MICLRHSDVLRLCRKVMRCVPLPSRALAHITSVGYITHEVYITFRESGTHRAKKSDCLVDKSLFFDGPPEGIRYGANVAPTRPRACRTFTESSASLRDRPFRIPSFLSKPKREHHTKGVMLSLWPARRDSNPRSSESESAALSSCATGGYRPQFEGVYIQFS